MLVNACTKPKNENNIYAIPLTQEHSWSNPDEIALKHLHLNLKIDFDSQLLKGDATLSLDRKTKTDTLHLDIRNLNIYRIQDESGKALSYSISKAHPVFGSDLTVVLHQKSEKVKISYSTTDSSEALQWLSPEQTHDKKLPFLFSQSQAILARTWVPIQDNPGVKFTYSADIQVREDLRALMSATNDTGFHSNGAYHFEQKLPISSYMLAIAAGNLQFKSLGPDCGVYAEPGLIEDAAWELEPMQAMIDSAEALYGAYPWGRYDVLFLPPSFPFGGMENPCLTFATPTILAGDRSLVSLIAHELAHSWSGNLVTNASWNDFWLNEGFTVYFEQRIMEKVYGKKYTDMLTVLGMSDLKSTLEDLKSDSIYDDSRLYLNLKGRNPDDGLTDIAYEKGRFFLQTIENVCGRPAFDDFLNSYFKTFSFQPMNSEIFLKYLQKELLNHVPGSEKKIEPKVWVYETGLPDNAPNPTSSELEIVKDMAESFVKGMPANSISHKDWTTHHYLYFLRNLPDSLSKSKLIELDDIFGFTQSGNAEIQCDWYKHTIVSNYLPAQKSMENFLIRVGRRKFLMPLYERLCQTEDGRQLARQIFEKARAGYHAVSENSVQELLNETSEN